MYKIEVERTDGNSFFVGGSAHKLWSDPEVADSHAEGLWLHLNGTGDYARFTVVDESGVVYTDWEC